MINTRTVEVTVLGISVDFGTCGWGTMEPNVARGAGGCEKEYEDKLKRIRFQPAFSWPQLPTASEQAGDWIPLTWFSDRQQSPPVAPQPFANWNWG
jgi:hypothetical protein